MLKKERLFKINQVVNSKGIVTINELMEEFDISDMTARRDLDELEKSGKLLRVHGGAQSLSFSMGRELSHDEKSSVEIDDKRKIVQKAASLVHEGETIFIGPGTTMQLFAEMLIGKNIRVVTNNHAVFNILLNASPTEVFLTGGEYRENTNCFVGPITNLILEKMQYNKAFISCNGIYNSNITTYSLDEGEAQQIALDNSKEKYLLADHTKFNRTDFYIYYQLSNFNQVITDTDLSPEIYQDYQKYTQIVIA